MFKHLKRHQNVYSLLVLALAAIMVAWLFLRVEALDIQVSKLTGNIFSAQPVENQLSTVGGSAATPTGPELNTQDVSISGQNSRADLNNPDASVDVAIPGDDIPNDSDEASADAAGLHGDTSDIPSQPEEDGDEDEGAESN